MNKPHYLYPDFRLLVMSKSPVLGTVKTRMQPALTVEESLQLHIDLSTYCLTQWQQASLCPLELWVAGDMAVYQEKILRGNLRGNTSVSLYPQQGCDLGERMFAAVNRAFDTTSIHNTSTHKTARTESVKEPVKGVVLLGTDCPFIDNDYLLQALNALRHHSVVIGPAQDGGYVLLGMQAPYEKLFTDIQWGTSKVFADTYQRIQQLNISCYTLPVLQDIDTVDDLQSLALLPINQALVNVQED